MRLEAECAACGERFLVQRFEFRCPSCRAEDVRVAGGEELLLESVQMEAI